MASSIKLILRNKPNKEGLYPLVVRITKDRKSTYVYTGDYIEQKHWDKEGRKIKKSHPNSVRLNNLLTKKLSEFSDTLLDLQSTNKEVSSKQIKRQLVRPLSKESFNTVSARHLADLEANKKFNQFQAEKPRITKFIEYSGSEHLSFKDINEEFLGKFIAYLKVTRKNSPQTIANYLIVIRTIFNRAIREGIVDRKFYPFGKGKIVIRVVQSEKVGLSREEVQRIEKLTNLSKEELHAKNVWLFSFYFAGMRVGDVLTIKWSDIYDGRLHYRMNKNDKLLSL